MQNDYIPIGVASLEKLLTKIKPGTSTAMKSAVVALFSSDSLGKLRYSNLIGLLQIDIDRQYKSKMLRIYDLETLSLAFQVEIYYGFQKSYRVAPNNEALYIFDYPRGSIGFLFRNVQEAQTINAKIISQCPDLKQYEAIKQRNLEEAKKKEERGGFFGKIKNFFGADEEQQEQHESEVISVKKETSIQFNLNDGTFNTSKIPPDWQEVFDALKLSKDDLNNKEVMGIIVEETIINQAKRQAQQESNQQLQKKIQEAERQIRNEQTAYSQDIKRSTFMNLPPPPPPPPPPILAPSNARHSVVSKRANLMDEIRSNNLRLKHVEVNNNQGQDQLSLDISDMNKEERNDHIANLQRKLQMRKIALNRRAPQDDQ